MGGVHFNGFQDLEWRIEFFINQCLALFLHLLKPPKTALKRHMGPCFDTNLAQSFNY